MMGKNTAALVRVPAATARLTFLTPFSIISLPPRPDLSRSVWILSVTTTALSTSMPTASINPIMDRIFRDNPRKYITPSVMVIEMGTARETIRVVATLRMKKYSMNSDNTMPSRPARSKSDKDSVTPSPWFSRKTRLMPRISGESATLATSSSTRLPTSTRLDPVSLYMLTPTA